MKSKPSSLICAEKWKHRKTIFTIEKWLFALSHCQCRMKSGKHKKCPVLGTVEDCCPDLPSTAWVVVCCTRLLYSRLKGRKENENKNQLEKFWQRKQVRWKHHVRIAHLSLFWSISALLDTRKHETNHPTMTQDCSKDRHLKVPVTAHSYTDNVPPWCLKIITIGLYFTCDQAFFGGEGREGMIAG